MQQTYHELQIAGVKRVKDIPFLELEQKIDCSTVDGIDYEEVKLWGFTPGDSSIVRKLLYQIPDSATLMDMEDLIQSYPLARIIRQISHEPVVSPSEREFVQQRLVSIEAIARRQLVRDNSTVYTDRYGMPVYAQNKLSLTGEYGDQDYRSGTNYAAIEVGKAAFDQPIYSTEL